MKKLVILLIPLVVLSLIIGVFGCAPKEPTPTPTPTPTPIPRAFTDATLTNLPADSDWSYGVALGDVDGDEDLDIIFANHD